MKVALEVFGALDGVRKPRDLFKEHPEVLDERRHSYFPALRHIRRTRPLGGKQKTMIGERGGENGARQESGQDEWHDTEYQGVMAKAPPCPERILKTPLPQQSSPSSRDEEGQWISVEHRRRRRVAFEEAAKRLLRYLFNSDDVKVGITELQEQLEIFKEAGISIKQVAQQAMNDNGQQCFKMFRQRLLVGPGATHRWKVSWSGKRVAKHETRGAWKTRVFWKVDGRHA